ncbi:MAG: Bug family tripartite tricarboxylate transporter substrate binding protein [Burkholderiaceae bacterium]
MIRLIRDSLMALAQPLARLLVSLALLPFVLPFAAQAQTPAGAYPSKPITLIAPYAVGGDSDLAARNFAQAAQKVLGVPVLVVNRTGASGVIGSAQALAAPADGYTLLLARPGSQSILPAIMPTRTKYRWDDYTFIGLLELNPYGCMARAAQYKGFDELASALKARGKSMNFGTAGTLTTNDMGPRQLFRQLNLGANAPTMIAYKGTNEATLGLMSGDVDFACGSIGTFLPQVRSGALRALMVTTPERLAVLPDAPTARELGFGDMQKIIGWSGIYGPPGLPQAVVDRLAEVMKVVAQDPAWIKGTEATGSIPYIRSPQDTREFAQAQFQIYRAIGESLNIIDKAE